VPSSVIPSIAGACGYPKISDDRERGADMVTLIPEIIPRLKSFVRDLPIGKGLWKIFVALRNSPAACHLWPLLSGALSLLVGFLICGPWPLAGTSARGILVGVNVVSTGVALVPRRIHGPLQKAIFVASDGNT
jgi:hypothetical protein